MWKYGIVCLVPLLLAPLEARAKPASPPWLERAWSDEAVYTTGGPSVTLEGGGSVLLVLPEATLKEASAAGVRPKDAVRLVLERWGQYCADTIDLNVPHPDLKVELFLARPVSLADAGPAVQGEVLSTVEALDAAARKAAKLPKALHQKIPKVTNLVVTSDDHVDFKIDYKPMHEAVCVYPGFAGS